MRLSRRQLLHLGGGVLGLWGARPGWASQLPGDRRLLVWWNAGGWDPTFVFDPHFESATVQGDPDAEPATVGGLPIAVAESRPSVTELFERWGDRACIVNGLSVGSISHDLCTRLALTGRRSGGADLGAVLASAGAPAALPYVSLGSPAYPGSLGSVLTPLNALLGGVVADTAPATGSLADAHRDALVAYLEAEAELRASSDRPRLLAWGDSLQDLGVLRAHADLLQLSEDPSAEELVEVGADLLASGLSRVLSVRAPLPDRTSWDSHTGNQLNQAEAFESSFAALIAVLELLEDSQVEGGSLLDRTTVLVMSEMGRTPILNQEQGKDHWPYTSALLLGAGVAGGRVVGATDEALVAREIDLASGEPSETGQRLTTGAFLAGLMQDFGVDSEPWLPGVSPFTAWSG